MKTHPSYFFISLLQWLKANTHRLASLLVGAIAIGFGLGFYVAVLISPDTGLSSFSTASDSTNKTHPNKKTTTKNPSDAPLSASAKRAQENDYRENLNYPKTDWRAYTPYDLIHNTDVRRLVEKSPRSHFRDVNVWVYTKAFAKRFGMPKLWIGGEDFTGALALAYREEVYQAQHCGLFGGWDNCRPIRNGAVLDVYLKHDTPTIPWNTIESSGIGGSGAYNSIGWLRTAYPAWHDYKSFRDGSWFYTDTSEKDDKRKRRKLGIDHISYAQRFDRQGFSRYNGGGWVKAFHRNILEGIDLISITGLSGFAGKGDPEMQLWLSGLGLEGYSDRMKEIIAYNKQFKGRAHKDMKPGHKIFPGKSFMTRVKIYDTQHAHTNFGGFVQRQLQKK